MEVVGNSFKAALRHSAQLGTRAVTWEAASAQPSDGRSTLMHPTSVPRKGTVSKSYMTMEPPLFTDHCFNRKSQGNRFLTELYDNLQ